MRLPKRKAPKAATRPAPTAPRPAGAAEFKFDGNHFVAGLYWHTLSNPARARTEIREQAKKEGFTGVVQRAGSKAQAGFSAALPSHGAYSAAAVLASAIAGSWIGIFRVRNDLYVLLAQNAGVIVPGSDQAGARELVFQRFTELFGLVPWEKIFLPPEFLDDYARAELASSLAAPPQPEQRELAPLLARERLKPQHRLRFLGSRIKRRHLVLGAVALAVLAGAASGWSKYQQHQEQQRLQRQTAEYQARMAQLKPPAPPWDSQPAALDFLALCRASLSEQPLALGGWTFESGACARETLRVRFTRAGSATLDNFMRAADGRYPGVLPIFSSNFEQVELLLTPPRFTPSAGELPLTQAALLRRVYSFFQERELAFTLKENDTAEAGSAKYRYDISLSGPAQPAELLSRVDWAVFRVSQLEVALKDTTLTWKTTGALYAKE